MPPGGHQRHAILPAQAQGNQVGIPVHEQVEIGLQGVKIGGQHGRCGVNGDGLGQHGAALAHHTGPVRDDSQKEGQHDHADRQANQPNDHSVFDIQPLHG